MRRRRRGTAFSAAEGQAPARMYWLSAMGQIGQHIEHEIAPLDLRNVVAVCRRGAGAATGSGTTLSLPWHSRRGGGAVRVAVPAPPRPG